MFTGFVAIFIFPTVKDGRIAYLTIKVNANLIEVVKLHKNNVLKLCEMPKVIIRENK